MVIIIITIPKYNHQHNIKSEENLFDQNYKYFEKFTKPFSIIAVIKIFIELYKYKFYRKRNPNLKVFLLPFHLDLKKLCSIICKVTIIHIYLIIIYNKRAL